LTPKKTFSSFWTLIPSKLHASFKNLPRIALPPPAKGLGGIHMKPWEVEQNQKASFSTKFEPVGGSTQTSGRIQPLKQIRHGVYVSKVNWSCFNFFTLFILTFFTCFLTVLWIKSIDGLNFNNILAVIV